MKLWQITQSKMEKNKMKIEEVTEAIVEIFEREKKECSKKGAEWFTELDQH